MKWLKLLPAVLAIMIGVTGCMANHPSFKDEALLYMQEKYGEAFTWVEPVDGQFGNAQKSGHCLLYTSYIYVLWRFGLLWPLSRRPGYHKGCFSGKG